MKFSELNISPELVEAVGYMGFENCTPIQEQAIPSILEHLKQFFKAVTLPILDLLVHDAP